MATTYLDVPYYRDELGPILGCRVRLDHVGAGLRCGPVTLVTIDGHEIPARIVARYGGGVVVTDAR